MRLIILITDFLLLALNCPALISAGSLDDICNKIDWQSPYHSERYSAYIPLITPAELMAFLDKYCRDIIKMRVLFQRIDNQCLNTWIQTGTGRKKISSKNNIAFSVRDPEGKVSSGKMNLFLKKSDPQAGLLLDLTPGAPILITGVVRFIVNGKAWIEVKELEIL